MISLLSANIPRSLLSCTAMTVQPKRVRKTLLDENTIDDLISCLICVDHHHLLDLIVFLRGKDMDDIPVFRSKVERDGSIHRTQITRTNKLQRKNQRPQPALWIRRTWFNAKTHLNAKFPPRIFFDTGLLHATSLSLVQCEPLR
jgi:hypothetical protein